MGYPTHPIVDLMMIFIFIIDDDLHQLKAKEILLAPSEGQTILPLNKGLLLQKNRLCNTISTQQTVA